MRIFSLLWSFSIFVISLLLGALLYAIHNPWIDISMMTHTHINQSSIILDDEGIEWARFQLHQGAPIRLIDIPKSLIDAFIATEDRKFYQHTGISLYGIVRSCVHNMYYRKFGQGASTITQQLVRMLFFDTQKTLLRKIKEQCLALIVERQFSKDQILEMYLNHIYFGAGIYGIHAAAGAFWNKKPAELTIDECAILAGIVKNPSKYCPLLHPINSLQRRNVVLSCMEQTGYISTQQLHELKAQPISILKNSDDPYHMCAPHAYTAIQSFLEEKYGRTALYSEGLIIKSTINRKIQEQATRSLRMSLEKIRPQAPKADGALVILESNTGAIKGLVGGYSPQAPFNRATQAYRQLGSTFKPIIYALALEHSFNLWDTFCDEQISMDNNGSVWKPRNVTRRFEGDMTLAQALATSNNIIPIKLTEKLGTALVAQTAEKCNLSAHSYPSLALGCIDATPVQAAGMFNIIANKGVYKEPHLISWIKNAQGKKIWQVQPATHQVFSWETTSMIIQVLKGTVQRWQQYLQIPPLSCAVCGKTGTTNDARNCWFVGATPTYTTAIYIGADDNSSMGDVYTTRTALPLFLEFNGAIAQPAEFFQFEPTLVLRRFDAFTGAQEIEPTKKGITLLVPMLTTAAE